MTILTKARTAALWYSNSEATSAKREVVSAGTRVCLRSYNVYSFSDASTPILFKTKANFRTTSDTATPLFSDYATQSSWIANDMGNYTTWIEIPGDGILFEDGLFIDLEKVTTRALTMNTMLTLLYS